MIDARAPLLDVVHIRDAGFIVGSSGGNLPPLSAGSHTEADESAGMEVGVAAVVPQPVFCKLASRLRA